MTDQRRYWLGRKLFQDWIGVSHPELLAAMWGALSREDREVWLERADRQLADPGADG